jgi:uracil-DNA glycosylase
MDAEARLRAFLQQRLEAGETEIVLDHMTAAEALMAVRAVRTFAIPGGPAFSDWRATLAAAGAGRGPVPERGHGAAAPPPDAQPQHPVEAPPPHAPASAQTPAWVPPPKPGAKETAGQPPRPGLVVGGDAAELFGGPLAGAATLEDISALVAGCTRCPLYQTAKNPVPGTGDARADLMVVGEAPGATEDEQGKPFVGAAGQLLTKILAAIQLSRDDVFITNVLKHRPPLNRNPLPHEVQACSPYLLRQLELIAPKAILALGTFAAQTLLQTTQTIGSLRGFVHRYHGIPLVVTYHPAALLRNPAWKRPTWQDVQLVRRILDSAAAGA